MAPVPSQENAGLLDRCTIEISPNTAVIPIGERTLYLVGTAHVSRDSVDEVRHVIETVRPDAVCVELCPTRYEALTDADRWKKLDVFQVIRGGKTLMLLANLAVGAYQRRIGAQLGVTPGAELIAGVEMAEEMGATLHLVDRDIRTTLRRTWANVGFWRKATLVSAVIGSTVGGEEIDEATIEEMKESGNLEDMLQEFTAALPEVKEPLIDERDLYMISRIREVTGDRIVAVVGAAHVPGMTANLNTDVDRESLEVSPARAPWVNALKWLIPLVVLAAFWVGYQRHAGEGLEEMLKAWILPNSVMAGLLTACAGAKILSILAAIISSPITSLNPLLGAGMVVGLLEAWLRRPTVEDAERINEDVQSLKGMYRNPFTRVLLVAVFSTLGSAMGAWIGIGWLLTLLGA